MVSPHVAIGSVNRETLPGVLERNPRGIALCTGIIAKDDPEGETRYYTQALGG
ncbi:MAG: hypothetical protein HQL31_11195 [Planctomycetes bacterium]|nr:hypothetical protein [Planctomycetota bacterium]